MLNINYRSSKKIVDFIKTVGYPNLQAENDVIEIDYLPTPRNINKFEIDNLDLNIQFDEKLNLAQMYYQIEEFAKAKEILMKLISDIHTPNEIKVHAQQLLIELKLNG